MAFYQWLEHSRWVTAISESAWMYPAVEVSHFFSLFLLVGTIAVVDLRILGLARRRQSVTELAEQLFPWTWISLGIAVFSGFIMFSIGATAFVANTQFRIKMLVTLLAVVFAVIVQRNTRKWDQPSGIPILAKFTAVISLALWIGVILAATEIANYSAL
ncbi:MAG TPA: DUF6644 family protein [Candidatus Acidoferrum sp.]|nr:DUF6644 family protein [Candidatus Acidoferrum sp.]